eukprot:scaffold55895_cov16-Tisochrysis_lutea.AAC.1
MPGYAWTKAWPRIYLGPYVQHCSGSTPALIEGFTQKFSEPSTEAWKLFYLPLVCAQVGKVLGNDPSGRAAFVHSGGLAAVQQMAEAPGSKLKEAVEIINSAYPEEIVKYYSPTYSQQLLEKLEGMSTTQAAY